MAKRQATNLVIIHCADTPAGMDVGAEEITAWHRQRGYLDIGYHYVIRRDGRLEVGRERDEIGAHALGRNKDSLGVCLVGGRGPGGKAENNFTPAQFAALGALLARLRAEYPEARVIGHREVNPKKACPSFDVQAWLKTI